MTDEQFIIHVLNSLTNDYKLQMILMEKRIGDKMNPLSIDELKEDLNLRYERLSTKFESLKRYDFGEERALFTTQYKEKCRNCGKLGRQSSQCRSNMVKDDKNEAMQPHSGNGHLSHKMVWPVLAFVAFMNCLLHGSRTAS